MTGQRSFETTIVVNFGDTDPAAIVYFPNIFHYCQMAFEHFLPEAADITYARMLADERIAFPTVEAKASFRKAIRYGDSVRIRVEIGHLGDSSVQWLYEGFDVEGDSYFKGSLTTVCISMDTFKSQTLPDKYRKTFSQYLIA
jgi:YbgC/YbaW family acyl-CoA thioester hydrolase